MTTSSAEIDAMSPVEMLPEVGVSLFAVLRMGQRSAFASRCS
jgi:hypothetical protein